MTTEPLLQPYRSDLTFKNGVTSPAHEPACSGDGLPKERYRLHRGMALP